MAIVAGKQALAAGALPYDPTRIGVVLGTGLGTLEETIAFMRGYLEGGPEAASPLLFPSSVMNAAAGQLALECKLRGVNSTVNHRDASPLSALTMACDLLALGRADALVVGGVDELSGPALAGYRKLGGAALVLGEGAAMLLVEREDDAQKRGARIRASSPDAASAATIARASAGAGAGGWPEAARACARPPPAAPSICVISGANGTAYDAREADGARPRARRRRVPSCALVPRIGESFSSGAQRLVAAVHALERGSGHARARARLRAGRRRRRGRPRARLMSRITPSPRAATPLPRVVARKPRRGDVHALSPSAIRAFLRALPVEQLRGLRRIELRARVDDVGAPFALYRREERDIILYSLPPDEWWMSALDRAVRARSTPRRRHASCAIATASRSTSPATACTSSCATCWRTRSAITCATRPSRATRGSLAPPTKKRSPTCTRAARARASSSP